MVNDNVIKNVMSLTTRVASINVAKVNPIPIGLHPIIIRLIIMVSACQLFIIVRRLSMILYTRSGRDVTHKFVC